MALTEKQQRFVEEYLVDLNATQAAIRAGFPPVGARQQGSRLLSYVDIQEAIKVAKARRTKRTELRADKTLREIAMLAHSDIGDIIDFSGEQPTMRPACQIPRRARRAISSVKVRRHMEGSGEFAKEVEVIEFKLWDKPSALEKAGKHQGLFKERYELSGPGGGPLVVATGDVGTMSDDELHRLAGEGQGGAGTPPDIEEAGAGGTPQAPSREDDP